MALIEKGKSEFEPNSKNKYSNSNYVLLSFILEKTYKNLFKNSLESQIIQLLGLQNTFLGSKINPKNDEVNSYFFENKWIKYTETNTYIPLGATEFF